MKTACLACAVLSAIVSPALAGEAALVDLTKIDRSIAKDPRYEHEPHYALIVFGPKAEHRSWLVMDGAEVLYFDRNGNGDLTEPDERLQCEADPTRVAEGSAYSGMNVFRIGKVAGVNLEFRFWVRKPGYVPKDEWQRKFLRERELNHWENGTLSRIADKGGHAQNPTLLTAKPADAQITHLDGPLTFGLKWAERQRLHPWPKQSVFGVHIGTPILRPRNCKHDLFSPLTEQEIPVDVHPVAVFEFPPKSPGGRPVVRTVELNERCCGDTVLAYVDVPHEAGRGVAKVTLSYASWTDRSVRPATFDVPIGGKADSPGGETAFVMFRDPQQNIGLNDALTALRVRGLTVQKIGSEKQEALVIRRGDHRMFGVTLSRSAKVAETAKALGAGTSFEAALAGCDARFEISILPASLVHEEQAALSELQSALQEEFDGVIYTWDGKLVGRSAARGNE